MFADLADLPTALRRVKADLKNRVFIRYPHEVDLVDVDEAGWLTGIEQRLRAGSYRPSAILPCDVPKGGGLLRPGNHIALDDLTVYTAAVGACLPLIHESLSWSQGNVDYGYMLSADPANVQWLVDRFIGWQQFRRDSLTVLEDPTITHVVIADISACYEHINLPMLLSDLRSLGAPADAIDQISAALNRWQVTLPGLPQGNSASDILAKVYLDNTVDAPLRQRGLRHKRYVDDIRIFCTSEIDAKRALVLLIQQLRRRGLNVQSAKTRIATRSQAADEIEHAVRMVVRVGTEFVQRAIQIFGADNPYVNIQEIDRLIAENPDDAPIDVLEHAYATYFGDGSGEPFDSTFFHYLLVRFAKAHNGTPLLHDIACLFVSHPEETEAVLEYLSQLNAGTEIEPQIVAFLVSDDAIYPYQRYQLLRWLAAHVKAPVPATVDLARTVAFDPSQPTYVRSVARALLRKHGTAADLDRLEAVYAETTSSAEHAELICCLHRVERGRRNALLARLEGDGEPQRRAVQVVRRM